MVVRDLYRWEPLGVIVLDDNGLHPRIDVYRMKERP
jgi:hypothetical protein